MHAKKEQQLEEEDFGNTNVNMMKIFYSLFNSQELEEVEEEEDEETEEENCQHPASLSLKK